MTAHAPAVSRALAAAGFDRAEQETTAVRGHYRYYPGYVVKRADGHVRVEHSHTNSAVFYGPGDPRPDWREDEADALAQYAAALTAAGYDVQPLDPTRPHGHAALAVRR